MFCSILFCFVFEVINGSCTCSDSLSPLSPEIRVLHTTMEVPPTVFLEGVLRTGDNARNQQQQQQPLLPLPLQVNRSDGSRAFFCCCSVPSHRFLVFFVLFFIFVVIFILFLFFTFRRRCEGVWCAFQDKKTAESRRLTPANQTTLRCRRSLPSLLSKRLALSQRSRRRGVSERSSY